MVIGWDIGGVNTKVARVEGGQVVAARGRPFELQRAPDALVSLLRGLAAEISSEPVHHHAVTMTAELSQMFRTKRQGVAFVLAAMQIAFPADEVHVFAVDGRFLSPDAARREPIAVAAANWAATARAIATCYRDVLLIDIGTTTTDIIPIVDGSVAAIGWNDPDRLAAGELVYTGVLRTPVDAIVHEVPYRHGTASVSAEGFALAGDVHLWRGLLAADDYTVPTPDGRPATREFCGERLARVICADSELIDSTAISRIADAIADAQLACIASAIEKVSRRVPSLSTAVVGGLGAFLAESAALAAGLSVTHLASQLGADAARVAPAAAVALLLEQEILHA